MTEPQNGRHGVGAEWALTAFDPWDRRIHYSNVWDMYRAMREAGPVVRSDAYGGFWCITRYQDVKAAAANFSTYSSAMLGTLIGKGKRTPPAPPIEVDRPEHIWYRKALQSPFLPSKISSMRDLVADLADEVVTRAAQSGSFDLLHDIAEPIPRRVICHVLGFDDEERQIKFRDLALDRIHATMDEFDRAHKRYLDFIRKDIVEAKLQDPGDGLIDELLTMEREGNRLELDEVAQLSAGLATAGYATTIHAIASLLIRTANPQVREACVAGEEARGRVVEEALRLDPPIHLEGRGTTKEVTVGDVTIGPGEQVALLYACANRDHRAFPEPDDMDFDRKGPSHLSFGHGIHKCVGAPLARMEMDVTIESVLEGLPNYRLASQPVSSPMLHGHHLGWEKVPAVSN